MAPPGMVRAGEAGGATGARIKEARKAAGFTQQSLAAEVQVSRQTVITMESGDYAPSVYLALKVARVLNTTVEELWGA